MKPEKTLLNLVTTIAGVAALTYLIAQLIPPPDSETRTPTASAVRVLSRHHHPQPTQIGDEPLSAEVGDKLEVVLAPQERITRPITELRMYCPHMDNGYWHAFADTKPVVIIPLNNAGYCRIVLIESLLPVPPGTGQFDGDMLKLRQLPQHFNCHFNPLFARILVAP